MKKELYQFLNIINAILYFVVIGLWVSISDEVTLCLSVSVVTILMSIILIVLQRERFKSFYMSSFFKSLTSNLVSIVLVFFILGIVNYLFYKNPLKVDFTKGNQNSLTEQTQKVTKRFDQEVLFKVFSDRANLVNLKSLVDLYKEVNNKVSFEFVDAALRPDLVSKYEISVLPSLVIEYKGKQKKILKIRELEVTNALIQLYREKTPIIYYVNNHGGPRLNNNEKNGLSHLKGILEKSAYEIRELDLLSVKKIPDNAKALMIWGPQEGFHKSEINLIRDYIDNGGHLITSLDPRIGMDSLLNLRLMLMDYGNLIRNNLIVDSKKSIRGSNGLAPIVSTFNEHMITANVPDQVFFPVVSSIEENKTSKNDGSFSLLAMSSDESWGEFNFDDLVKNKVEYDANRDIKGPLGMVSVWKANDKKIGKVVVYGNSSFVTNQYMQMSANFLFFANSVDWIVGDELIASFDRPEIIETPVFISAPQVGVIFYFSVLFIPLLFGILSLVTYRRRRVL